ncbi:S-adenosyl-L-methionine-dependent methyltransferases superfamily protein [Quillaja saponaria]|uniref:S-adenosyl-L-methionine-dependent methyltransferases superfamily protein n=1 Tax=Quillaja saponaria TaxID=32244 RepID=A0AAD7QIK2_QUISA|nr:S-adenosyl-L-methionine-dependent methyltransferases superfamily protein [Quillaja saponaria]
MANTEFSSTASTSATDTPEEESFQVLAAIKSEYNDIVIVDSPKSRMLLLDSSYNVHSIFYKEQKWTNSYWDEFASLPAIVPKGPIAIFGLLDGWEIDQILIDKAREYLGLFDLEKPTQDGGLVNVCIGDALSPAVNARGKYAGIIVDLAADGKVLPQLQEVTTWLELHDQLMPNGRFMVNCGGIDGGSGLVDANVHPETSSVDITWLQNPTMKALSKAYPGQLSWKRMPKENGANYMALTGPFPDLNSWSASIPSPLSTNVKNWRPCGPFQ